MSFETVLGRKKMNIKLTNTETTSSCFLVRHHIIKYEEIRAGKKEKVTSSLVIHSELFHLKSVFL